MCADLETDMANCGSCGNACGAAGTIGTAQTCAHGACTCDSATPKACGAGSAAYCVGAGVDCLLTIDPKSWTFPEVVVNTSPPPAKTFTVKNVGSVASGVLTAKLAIASNTNAFFSFELTPDTCSGSTLAPGTTCSITVTQRTNSGTRGKDTATLTVLAEGGSPVVATLEASICGGAGYSCGAGPAGGPCCFGLVCAQREEPFPTCGL